MALTILDEVMGERVDLIEHQQALAATALNGPHIQQDSHLPARRMMMQRWADYLDTIPSEN